MFGDRVIDDEAQYERKLPQLGDDSGRIVHAKDVDRWMEQWQASVDDAAEKVLEIGVDRCLAALEQLGVISESKDWEDL